MVLAEFTLALSRPSMNATSALFSYAIISVYWIIVCAFRSRQTVQQDAENRAQFLLHEDRKQKSLKLSSAVQDLQFSNSGLRRENIELKNSIASIKEDASFAVERFWIDFDESVVPCVFVALLNLLCCPNAPSTPFRITFVDGAKPLGRGATAVVLLADVYGQRCAVKKLDALHIDELEEGAETLFRELEMVSPLEHRNVIEVLGGCKSSAFSPMKIPSN